MSGMKKDARNAAALSKYIRIGNMYQISVNLA